MSVSKEQYEKYPQLKVTVDQLQATKQSPATQGALVVYSQNHEMQL